MSLTIDPAKIHLGGVVAQYYTEYLLVPLQDQPAQCVLPSDVPLTLSQKPLLPLNPVCEFQFPPVIPIPPVYIPPPPTITTYPACSTMLVTTDVATCPATKNSYLALSSSGPEKTSDGSPSECKITLEGSLCVEACESFSASSALTFSGAASGSSLTLDANGQPDCGFILSGDINVNACETMTTSADVSFLGAAAGSFLTISSRNAPSCGVDITGAINVNACETFTAISNVNIYGTAVDRFIFTVDALTAPDCGVIIAGDVEINACKEITVQSNVQLNGSAFTQKTKRYAKIGEYLPDKGTYAAAPSSSPAASFKPLPAPATGAAAPQQPPVGYSDSMITESSGSSLQLVVGESCGVTLLGEINIQACTDFNAEGSIVFSGKSVTTVKPITVTPSPQPDCGFKLAGEIKIDACQETIISTSFSGGKIHVSSAGVPFGTIDLAPSLTVTKGKDGCSNTLELNLKDGYLDLVTGAGNGINGVNGSNGSGYGGDVNNSNTSINVTNVGGITCYHCNAARKCQRKMNLEVLEVTSIYQTQMPCCESYCPHYINLCEGTANLGAVHADLFLPGDCSSVGLDNYLDLGAGQLYLASEDNSFTMYASGLSAVMGTTSVTIAGSSLTLDNPELGSVKISNYYATFIDIIGANKGEFSGGYLTLTSTGSGGCGATYLEPGGVTFINSDGAKTTAGADTEGAEGDTYTTVCKDSVVSRGSVGMISLDNGELTCSDHINAGGVGLNSTTINKGSVVVKGMDSTITQVTGAAITQTVPKYPTLGNYLYPGVMELKGASAQLVVDDGTMTISTNTTGTSINLAPHGLPANTNIYFQEIDVCVDGKTKKAWVLMSDPQ